MSFVMIATGAASRSRVRTLSLRQLVVAGAAGALLLLSAGAAVGYWAAAPRAALPVIAQERAHPMLPFTLEQLGALSGRLFKLESQAAQLSQRLGVQPGAQAQDSAASSAKAGGRGGPMLPPRASQETVQDFGAIEAQVARLEQQIALVTDAATERALDLMRLPTRLPIPDAEIGSGFGNREDPFTHHRAFHAGLDFAAEQGTPIRASAGGTVAFAGFHPDFGWMVEIEHGNGLATRYAHASRLLVKQGAVVAPGDRIALVGTTGRSTGPHLHFEVLRHGEPTDPRRYLAGL
jgi:murein DD-endopeptidase MepM/ murein hydrolase activator NlpD